ncbi:MAG: flagellar biosynthesis protein FlhA [Hyphomicrobiales bacterium]|nr:MAG: flagellar biosynthesis protein FlhA [Hyphomicrobiales bacterium]
MAATPQVVKPVEDRKAGAQDIGFAVGIVFIVTVLFMPLPAAIIDVGLAFSIALSVLILMVALWIQKPLDFSAFPTVLLIATVLRLALNIATTRQILSHGNDGPAAAGHVIAGFANFVMGGDFVIGTIVFVILITVNFLVITKGATRIAEVGARFTLDAIPGKQMAIDADLNAGNIDDKEAMRRRRELEEESSFFGSMDGASKFVRGDAIAGIIITAVNVFGGIVIGVTRHGMSLGDAADVFVKLSVGDGLVTQIPALIVSLAAGLLVSKGGTRGSAEKAILDQLGNYPRALMVAGVVMMVLALAPRLPFLPFALLGTGFISVALIIPRRRAEQRAADEAKERAKAQAAAEEAKNSVKEQLKTVEIELCLGKQIGAALLKDHSELAQRVAKMRRKFASQYGFVVPEIRLGDDLSIPPKSYQVKIHGTVVATEELRIGDVLVITGEGHKPDVPGDETREPAFGMKAMWIPEMFMGTLKQNGFRPVDNMSVLLTHLREVIRNNLAQLFSYKDMRALLDRLEPEYRRLIEEIAPSQISYSGMQAVLKLLLAERISIRNLHLILEAIAEVAPHVRRAEALAEHVRMRLAQQICGDLSDGGQLKVLRLGSKWETTFHQALKRDGKGDVVEFDIDPRLIEQFGSEATKVIRGLMDQGHQFVLVAAPDARPYVRMVTERLFPNLAVLSHVEIARGVQIKSMGTIST